MVYKEIFEGFCDTLYTSLCVVVTIVKMNML